MGKNLPNDIKLITLTIQETLDVHSGNKVFKYLEHQFNISDLIPEDVIQASLDNHKKDEDWFWCAPRLFYSVSKSVLVGSGVFISTLNKNEIEIGYGVISPFEGQGFATAGVGCLIKEAATDGKIEAVLAQTSIENIASAHVLEKNSFIRRGQRQDKEDGLLILWKYETQQPVC